jgi:predicted aldo/keto reductase-like oxidoreductase
MGVFIISPNDKGGMLYSPSAKLVELCHPLHPMVFNGLFCLSRAEVHTLSCGVSRPSDFDIHLETVRLLERADEVLPPIMRRLEDELARVMGDEWAATWDEGLPEWDEVPGEVNVRWILRLRNLALAYDLVDYGKMRYNLLGSGGNWFPGRKAESLESLDLAPALANSPFADRIPAALAEAHTLLSGEKRKRLQEA